MTPSLRALRSRSPDALPELLDASGDQLFSYCWRLLRNREYAQIAVRDALVVATAQIERLVCDEWLGLWLYSLVRAECLRREAVPASDADEPVALPNAVTLTVSVTRGSGAEFVFVYSSPLTSGATVAPSAAPSASQAVEVTWTTGRPRGPRPSPSPSDSSSPSPSPSASAAPSSVLGGS
jgi:hypothetical protein